MIIFRQKYKIDLNIYYIVDSDLKFCRFDYNEIFSRNKNHFTSMKSLFN